MQFNPVNSLIAMGIGCLSAYGLWSIAGNLGIFIAVGGSLFLSATLVMAIGARHENARSQTNLSILSLIFFMIGLCINLAFCFSESAQTAYILTSALTFLVYVFICNFFIGARQ